MWDVWSTVLDLLLLATHWRFYVCVLVSVTVGVLIAARVNEAALSIPTAFGLFGAVVGWPLAVALRERDA